MLETTADPTAVMGRRVIAVLIDLVIAVALTGGVIAGLAYRETISDTDFVGGAQVFCDIYNEASQDFTECLSAGDYIFILQEGDLVGLLALPIFLIANLVLLGGATGASLGKHIMGLRVVMQSNGALHRYSAATVRFVVWLIDAIPFPIPLVAILTSSMSKGHRRVGDMAASTLVVDRSQVGVTPVVPGLAVGMGVGVPTPAAATRRRARQTQRRYARLGTPTPTRPEPKREEPPGTERAKPVALSPERVLRKSEPAETASPGVGAPLWDDARDTYVQWDPRLKAWMEWSDSKERWIRISR